MSANITAVFATKIGLSQGNRGSSLSAKALLTVEREPMSNKQPAMSSDEERNMTSLGNILGILIGFVSPLIFWLIYKDRSDFVDRNLKSALNFQITMIIAWIAASILTAVTFGILSILYLVIGILILIFCIMAFVKTRNGEDYKYPMSIPFIK